MFEAYASRGFRKGSLQVRHKCQTDRTVNFQIMRNINRGTGEKISQVGKASFVLLIFTVPIQKCSLKNVLDQNKACSPTTMSK